MEGEFGVGRSLMAAPPPPSTFLLCSSFSSFLFCFCLLLFEWGAYFDVSRRRACAPIMIKNSNTTKKETQENHLHKERGGQENHYKDTHAEKQNEEEEERSCVSGREYKRGHTKKKCKQKAVSSFSKQAIER